MDAERLHCGRQPHAALASKLDVEFQSAEKMKRQFSWGLSPRPAPIRKGPGARLSTHGDLSTEMRCLLDDFELQRRESRVGCVVVSRRGGPVGKSRRVSLPSPASRESSVTPFVQYDAVERVLRLDLRWWGVLVPAVGLARRGAAER